MKKIIIVANSDLTFDQRLQRITGTLYGAGYSVEILGRAFNHSPPLQMAPYPQQRLNLFFQKGKLAYIELNIRIFLWLIRQKMDALCSVDLDTMPACWLYKKLRPVCLIHDAHEYMEQVPEVFDRPLTQWMWRQIAQICLPSVDFAYTVSQSFVQEFRRIFQKEFGLVRNIAFLKEPDMNEPNPYGSGYWVFLGAVNRGRGLEEFLEVLPFTKRQLLVLGAGDRLEALKEMVQKAELDHLVIFAGKVTPDKARRYMMDAWAGINLLTDEGLSYRYSLANKFCDYVHAGIPQICIDFQEYQILNAEFEVAVLTPLIKEKLLIACELISNPDIRQRLIQQTTLARREWNWQKESEELLRLYQKHLPLVNN